MTMDLDKLIESARRNPAKPTPRQRSKMKRGIVLAATVGATGVSALTIGKMVLAGMAATVIGAVTTVEVMRVKSLKESTVEVSVTRPVEHLPERVEPIPRVEVQEHVLIPVKSPPRMPAAVQSKEVEVDVPRAVVVQPVPARAQGDTQETPDVPLPSPSRQSVTSSPSVLSVELRLIRAAAEALDARDFEAAGVALDRYDVEVRRGTLSTEAAVLRVLLQCEMGETELAIASATSLVKSDPASPIVQRLYSSCASKKLNARIIP